MGKHTLSIFREICKISRPPQFKTTSTLEPRQAIFDVGTVADFTHLTVIDNIDPTSRLLANDIVHCLAHFCLESGLIYLLTALLCVEHLLQIVWARQAPCMGRKDSL